MNNVIVKEKYGCKGININFLKIYVLKFIDLKSEQLVLCFFFFFFFYSVLIISVLYSLAKCLRKRNDEPGA